MIKWIKNLFKEKIYLPIWFFILDGHNDETDTLNRIVEALNEDKDVIIKINGAPHIVSKVDGVISVRELDKSEYRVDV